MTWNARRQSWTGSRRSRNAVPWGAGARLTGAGWGGCAIAVGDEDALRSAAPELLTEYSRRFEHGARAWVTRAAGQPSVP